MIFPDDLSEDNLIKLASDVEVIVGYKISKTLLEAARKLRHFQVPWTGSEHLDYDLLKKYPITVSNSHSNAIAIAEHAVALLMAAAKFIVRSDQLMRKGDWTARYDNVSSFWLSNKTLGVIGYGAIGKKTAEILKKAFNMKVLAITRHQRKNATIDGIADFVGWKKEDLYDVLKKSDFILVAVPLTSETKGLIGEREFQMMKKTAIICNISRGPVIDQKALFMALKERIIAGAGIDVWYNYPKNREEPINVFQDYPFETLDNIIMSPHRASKVIDREFVHTRDIITNLKLVFEGKPPINQLNLDLGY